MEGGNVASRRDPYLRLSFHASIIPPFRSRTAPQCRRAVSRFSGRRAGGRHGPDRDRRRRKRRGGILESCRLGDALRRRIRAPQRHPRRRPQSRPRRLLPVARHRRHRRGGGAPPPPPPPPPRGGRQQKPPPPPPP